MKTENICKFISGSSSAIETVETHSFVQESDTKAMKHQLTCKNHMLILGVSGNGKAAIDSKIFDLNTGTLLFVFRSEIISVSPDDNCTYMYIEFSGMRCDTLFLRYGINNLSRSFPGFKGLIPLWKEGISSASEGNIDLVSEGILLYTLSKMTSTSPKQNVLINQIIQFTQEHFSNPDLSVSFISEKFNYNPKYVSHIFKEKTGMGYSEHLRNIRIRYAISLLDHGIDSIKNVAFLTGFSDPLYFSTVFKKTVGLSPREYLQQIENPKQ